MCSVGTRIPLVIALRSFASDIRLLRNQLQREATPDRPALTDHLVHSREISSRAEKGIQRLPELVGLSKNEERAFGMGLKCLQEVRGYLEKYLIADLVKAQRACKGRKHQRTLVARTAIKRAVRHTRKLLRRLTRPVKETFRVLLEGIREVAFSVHPPMRARPRGFIGSASESLPIARCIQRELSDRFEIRVWKDTNMFGLGKVTIDVLEKAARAYDFGVFVFSPDDKLATRGKVVMVARDNVLFELGLFMGALTRFRTFVVANEQVKLPQDLSGMTVAHYRTPSRPRREHLAPACKEIRCALLDA